jgi:hypothetical protein
MTDCSSSRHVQQALDELTTVVRETVAEAERTDAAFARATAGAEQQLQHVRQSADRELATARKQAINELREQRLRLQRQNTSDLERTQLAYDASVARIGEKAEHNETTAAKHRQEAIWLAETVFDAGEPRVHERYELALTAINGQVQEFGKLREQAARMLARSRIAVPADAVAPPPDAVPPPDAAHDDSPDPATTLNQLVDQAKSMHDRMAAMKLLRWFRNVIPLVVTVGVAGIAALIAAALDGWQVSQRVFLVGGLVALASIAGFALAYALLRTRARALWSRLVASGAAAEEAAARARVAAATHRDDQLAQLTVQRDHEVDLAQARHAEVMAKVAERRAHHLQSLHVEYPRKLKDLRETGERELADLQLRHEQRLLELARSHDDTVTAAQQRFDRETESSRVEHQRAWDAIIARWRDVTSRSGAVIDDAREYKAKHFPAWRDPRWLSWSPPRAFLPSVPFGELHVDLRRSPGGLPVDERLQLPCEPSFEVPALLSFPDRMSLLLLAGDHGRDAAVMVLQDVMLRLLTSIPPGKVRLTVIDPVSLGQNFAGFMHLSDFDGALVGEKIWTEERHIEQRLVDLTEHMENVIQKYLRNQYETISEYNEDAGEIAEPFRFLVIANFPVNFNENAARRLASIISSGARCGVYTLMMVDTRQALPPGISMTDLRRNAATLAFDQNQARWDDKVFGQFDLSVEDPPDDAFITQRLHSIGEAAKDSSRVEVPFDIVAPRADQMWSADTTSEIRVPLGRAGATKLQYLSLGHGTAQHALIAGKTGSGKSTLLHALITNLALWYSPDQVEFYLIDFKKGVEFKTYATNRLPHARAVAIESDREFGLSVLQRLDAELKERGNAFRAMGVQDLAGYRRSSNGRTLPRTLLIIDEFQELFTEDDKIAQEAALLLDRLVRQGRAFGMHVLLGSQTLGGAYTLARSTIGQMAVRIALQCSESDSYLILSDDNAAARLLSRPGEAIYNDASGTIEGNNPFQIVWLADEARDVLLDRVRQRASDQNWRAAQPQVVFEGNVPADIVRNAALVRHLERAAPAAPPKSASAWLGDAIAIKEPTAATFRRQSASNLLIVGQNDEPALALLSSSMLSIAAQFPPDGVQFVVLDGSTADSPHAGYLQSLCERLPIRARVGLWRDVPEIISELSAELARREQSHPGHAAVDSPIFLLIHGLQRFRMLRQEDDFSFSSDPDAPPRTDKQLASLLAEGPHHGMHSIIWCDTAGNVQRSLERLATREFDMRVLFQMGASDSSQLIDSPLATKLGLNRALFFSEEHGTLEKFRPYALPEEPWLADVAKRLAARRRVPSADPAK